MLADVTNKSENVSGLTQPFLLNSGTGPMPFIDGWWLTFLYMEIQGLSFCPSCGSSSPRALKYFASNPGKGKERTGNVHLLPILLGK